ncbi:MAG: hypothetical protein K8F52_16650 [Candidatus Scalindua rubra]|nr:hypothetical protein [Candidatus Scalindua rubra]
MRIITITRNFQYRVTNIPLSSPRLQIWQGPGWNIQCMLNQVPFRAGGKEYRLWTDPRYSNLKLSTPDIIERSLIHAVMEGRAEYALDWYREH